MAELLVKAVSATHLDAEKDIRGCYKKGDIVVVMDDGHTWGAAEGPPLFVVVKVPGLATAVVEDRRNEWVGVIDYVVVGSDPVLDGMRVRLFETVPGAANEYGLTLAKVSGWITSWGGTVFSSAANEVVFDITVEDAYTSEGFWGVDPTTVGVIITETDYNQSTGVHTAEIDFTSATIAPKIIQNRVLESGATITGIVGTVATVEFERAVVRQNFIDDLQGKTRETYVRRRYHFEEADVDTVLAAGGEITLTTTQLLNQVVDKAS